MAREDRVWRLPEGARVEDSGSMQRQRAEALENLRQWRVEDDLIRTVEILSDQSTWGEEVVIESIVWADDTLTVSILFLDRKVSIRDRRDREQTGYGGLWLGLRRGGNREVPCPKGSIQVRPGIAVWVQTCRNGAGYWRVVQEPICLPSIPPPSGGSPPPPAKRRKAPEQDAKKVAEQRFSKIKDALSLEVLVLLACLYESTTREVGNLRAAMNLIAYQFSLSCPMLTAIWSAFLKDPGITEFHLIMAISAASNDESLPVSDRLRLREAAGILLRDGLSAVAGQTTSSTKDLGEDQKQSDEEPLRLKHYLKL